MGYLGLAQPLALSSPLTNSQLPFPLFVNGNEISRGVSGAQALSYRLRDPGFAGPQTFEFTIRDHTNAVAPWIAKQQRVIWSDAVGARYLFQGYVTDIHQFPRASWLDIAVTCQDLSSALDYGRPVISWDAGTHGASDQAEIQALLANYAQEMHLGSGGFIQVINGSMPASTPTDRTTLRNAIDLVLAATGVTGAVAYVDSLGFLHTMTLGDVNAPFNITDAPPPWTTAVPAIVDVLDQGTQDVDALYVVGSTAAGSGPVYAWQCGITTPPRSPLRWAVLDAPQAKDATTRNSAATVEFARRVGTLTVTLTVTGYDGWAKGQLVKVTNGPLGWVAKQFTINAVDMDVIAGTGTRRYTITAGQDPVLFTSRVRQQHNRKANMPTAGSKVTGGTGYRPPSTVSGSKG